MPITPDALEQRWNANASLVDGIDLITVWCLWTGLDFSWYTATLTCGFSSWGRFVIRGRFAAFPWPINATLSDRELAAEAEAINATLILQIGATHVELKNGDLMPTTDVKLSLGARDPRQVDISDYPNFRVLFKLGFQAWWDKGANSDADPTDIEPPVMVHLELNVNPMYTVDRTACQW
jgi:hypothetical protein